MCPDVCMGWCVKKTDKGDKENWDGKKEEGKEGDWDGKKEDDSGSKGVAGKECYCMQCKEEWEQNSDGDWVECDTGKVWDGDK